MKKTLLFLFIILLFLQFANADSPVKKVYVTSNINPHPPVIDGKLDDPVWDKVPWAGDFIQRSPDEGKEPSQATVERSLLVKGEVLDSAFQLEYHGARPAKILFFNGDTLVVRWEYIPGSSLYFVWSQGRTRDSSVGDFSLRKGIRDLFSIHPHNVFLVKFSYCFQL